MAAAVVLTVLGALIAVGTDAWKLDFCPDFQKVQEGTLLLEHALAGKHLTFGMPLWDQTDPTGFKWKNGQPSVLEHDADVTDLVKGLHVSILEAVAKHANFTYTIRVNTKDLPGSSQWLLSEAHNYDIVLGSWTDSLKRRQAGYLQPYPLVKKDPRLIVLKQIEDPPLQDVILTFLKPFSTNLWVTLLVCGIVTAGFMWLFETSQVSIEEGGEVEMSIDREGALKSMWLSGLQFTGGGGYAPVTAWGRLLLLSWSFVIMVVVAAYTANLATFLIVQQKATATLSSFEDAQEQRATICSRMKWSIGEIVEDRANGLIRFVDVTTANASQVRKALDEGKCQAYVSYDDIGQLYLSQKSFNAGCKYGFVGGAIEPLIGGWPMSVISLGCPLLLLTSLAVAMKVLDQQGALQEIWDTFATSLADMEACSKPEVADDGSMGVREMMGVLFVHTVFLGVAGAAWYYYKNKEGNDAASRPLTRCFQDDEEESASNSAEEEKWGQFDRAYNEAFEALQRMKQFREASS